MDPIILQRLSFIKYLFSVAQYQSHQPEPICNVSILSFHDSVELFLQLALQRLNISKESRSFIEYWEVIDKAEKGIKLSQKESMKKLNKARVSLKHYGILATKLDIESYRATTLAFFDENCPIIFNINFDEVSLIDSITYERPRELLKKAKNQYENGLMNDALLSTGLSFSYLISEFEKSRTVRYKSPFNIGKSMLPIRSDWFGHGSQTHDIKQFMSNVSDSITAIQEVLRLLCFGIDFKKYAKFRTLVPSIKFAMDGTPHYYINHELPLEKEDFEFCISFIVEAAIKLQEFGL